MNRDARDPSLNQVRQELRYEIQASAAEVRRELRQEIQSSAAGLRQQIEASAGEMGRLSARHVQRILSGASPKDLPVEVFHRVQFALNLRTAREIGISIPPAILVRADKVIQ